MTGIEGARVQHAAVVIPAKDEAARIEATVQAAFSIPRVDLVVVVDDGSSDATAAIAQGAGALVVRHRVNQGKAAAMATGARLIAMRENADRADGAGDHIEHIEEPVPGHTGELPVVLEDGEDAPVLARPILFIDGDMQDSAANAAPLIDAVLDDGVDMAIATLPPQEGAAGMGLVVRTARNGIERATGFVAEQPLSGTRCITRETWDAVQPLAPGWGVETGLTIDALDKGFWVKEIPAELSHRATGRDMRSQLHRAAQLRDVMRALRSRRHLSPNDPLDEPVGDQADETD